MAHMLRAMYANNKSAILVNGKPTKWFDVLQGVRQGGTESPLLFKIFIDGLVEKLREVDGGVDMNADTLLSIVLFADDIVLLASSRVALQKMINVVAQYSHKWRFQENLGKCGVMSVRVGKRGRKCPPLVFFGQDIAEVQEYKYLGVMVSEDLSWTKHIEYTLKKARKAVTKYKTIFTNRKLPIKMRLTVYKIYVRTRMEYAAQIWFVDSKQATSLEAVQQEALKDILQCNSKTNNIAAQAILGVPPPRYPTQSLAGSMVC